MEITDTKKTIFSAIQPTGSLTIGNYIGAVKNFLATEDEYNCFYAVANLHSLTVDLEPSALRKNTYDLMAMFLAFGLDPNKSTIFVQSQVPAHAELAWALNCYTQFGEAKRMTQFKDKSARHPDNINVGLFSYPVLMAADILLYQADFVPIGKDQSQHLELARVIAERFNNKFSPTFVAPQGIYPKHGGEKIYSLADPSVKMSKSDPNPNGFILLTDTPETIARKFKRAVTDSEQAIRFDPKAKAGVSNLLTIYTAFTGLTMADAEREFASQDYATLKSRVADATIAVLQPLQKRYNDLIADKRYLEDLMRDGAAKAAHIAQKTLSKVYRKIGII